MDKLITSEISEYLRTQLTEWGDELVIELEKSVDKYDLVVSNDLKKSIRRELIKQSESVQGVRIQFAVQGKFRDMQTKYKNKMPPVQEILDYINKIGLGQFKYVPGMKNKVPTDNEDKKRIAWGIAMSRINKAHKMPKPKRWKNKRISGAIYSLTEMLLQRYTEITGLAITQK